MPLSVSRVLFAGRSKAFPNTQLPYCRPRTDVLTPSHAAQASPCHATPISLSMPKPLLSPSHTIRVDVPSDSGFLLCLSTASPAHLSAIPCATFSSLPSETTAKGRRLRDFRLDCSSRTRDRSVAPKCCPFLQLSDGGGIAPFLSNSATSTGLQRKLLFFRFRPLVLGARW